MKKAGVMAVMAGVLGLSSWAGSLNAGPEDQSVFDGIYVLKGSLQVAAFTPQQERALKQSKIPSGDIQFRTVNAGERVATGQFLRSGKSGVRFLLNGHTVIEACQAAEFGISTVPIKNASGVAGKEKADMIYVFSGRVGLITHPGYLPPNHWVAITDGKQRFKTQGGRKVLTLTSYNN